MTEFFTDLWANRILMSGITGWLTAQILKMIIHSIVNHTLDWERLIGDGGMPSGHSATVTAMATTCLLTYGVGSFEFAISMMLAVIVMHDASGVRLETGKQAKVLNELLVLFENMSDNRIPVQTKLKEFVGHTKLQVAGGFLLGILISIAYYYL